MGRLRFFVVAGGLVLLASASVVRLTPHSPEQPKGNAPVAATYAHGVLRVAISQAAPRSGSGLLVVEVLDPEDGVVQRLDRRIYAKAGEGFRDQELQVTLPVEHLIWHRLRYRFTFGNETAAAVEGIASISQVLRRPVVHVLGQPSYASGGPAAVRLIVTEEDNESPVTSGTVRIELLRTGHVPQVLYAGRLNERGTTQAQFRFPAGLAGSYGLRYAVDTTLGAAEFTQSIQLADEVSILLTTEKPIYQPGQTIHARALALHRSSHQAADTRRLTFELEDSRGNKVFRKITQTDSYGIASAEFGLADEVNLGAYHLRALLDGAAGAGEAAPSKAELALEVARYVLPKYKVAIDLDGKDAKARRGYRPGDHVTGTVRATYFFGKPVDHAEVTVGASGMDVAAFDAGSAKGRTGSDGTFRFDIRLPSFFAGHPASQGIARILIEATVKDGAGHSETRGEPISASESPLLVTAVPEGGTLIPGLENQVFVLTSYPDGTPAQAGIRVHTPGAPSQTANTDRRGVAIVRMRGTGGDSRLRVEAWDQEGNRADVPVTLLSRAGTNQILLRTERAVYRAGERIVLEVFSTKPGGAAYVDVVKDRQTVASYDLEMVNGRAELGLVATPKMAGTVEFNAYLFGRDARPVGDRRLVFVQPAEELRIETTLDAPVYKPGGEARIGFRVTNGRGEGVQAALGLQVVDQAVFALAEKQPGFAKVFFYLEQGLLKPRHEIHSMGLPETITAEDPAESSANDRAARALFSATEMVRRNDVAWEFGRTAKEDKYWEYIRRYQKRFLAQVDQLATVLVRESGRSPGECGQARMVDSLRAGSMVDAWGNRLRIDDQRPGSSYLFVRSAGPDGRFGTADDLIQHLEDRNCFRATGGVTLRIEHGRGPMGDFAEVAGMVRDSSGSAIPNAGVELGRIGERKVSRLSAGPDGQFRLTGLQAGQYRLRVTSPGFVTAAREFSVQARDRAVFSVMLNVGSVQETVEVWSEAPGVLPAPSHAPALPPPPPPPSKYAPAGRSTTIATAETHVRSWFPEALYIAPEIVTDRQGRASITIPIADNITTWRMAMLASTQRGALGSGTSSLKVFQDFFTELDLPVTLTQGDMVSIPVAVYNYSGSRGHVRLRLQQDDWFSLVGDTADKELTVQSDRVGGSQYTIEARHIGKFKLTLRAEMRGSAKRADIVVREIEVVPNGREQSVVFNGRLDSNVQHQVRFPADAIPEASAIFVRLYPGPLSQVIEGMGSLLRMPHGCFEQTSSSTYPNILALDYMKRTKKLTPEVRAKAEGYIATGYQRLLTFEVPGGGFSWFGSAPANKILTSYGLMEFSDMSKVHDVDARVMERTGLWLAGQQQSDGSWKPDTQFINEGATKRYNTDVLRITAYVAWALETAGYPGPAIDRAKRYIEGHLDSRTTPDVYTLAVLANFATDYARDRVFTERVMRMLLDSRTEQGDQAWWNADETAVYAVGASAVVETTGLAAQALVKWGGDSDTARKAINYVVSKKDASGTWGTTQATIMALRALVLSSEKGGGTARGTVEVVLNGRAAEELTLTPENNDLLHQFVLKNVNSQPTDLVEIRFHGEGSVAYQVAGRYFTAWEAKPAGDALSIDVSYDRTRLEQDQIATATAVVRNHLGRPANMIMVDLGIPPGFELLSEDLETYREKSAGQKSGCLEKFSLTATQAILYFDSIGAGDRLALSYRLRAKYPIRARGFASRVYEYYAPEAGSLARPVGLEVLKR